MSVCRAKQQYLNSPLTDVHLNNEDVSNPCMHMQRESYRAQQISPLSWTNLDVGYNRPNEDNLTQKN